MTFKKWPFSLWMNNVSFHVLESFPLPLAMNSCNVESEPIIISLVLTLNYL